MSSTSKILERLESLRREIAIGTAQADRGELVDGDEALRRIRERNPRTQN